MALNLDENWDKGVLTWKQIESSNFEQKSIVQLYLLTNVNNLNKSKTSIKFSLGLYQLCSHHSHCNRWGQPPEACFSFLLVNGSVLERPSHLTHQPRNDYFSPSPPHSGNKIRATLSLGQSMRSPASASHSQGWGNEGPNKVSNVCCLRITLFLNFTFKSWN